MELAPKILYSRKEAAGMLSISVSTLDSLISFGKLRATRKGRRVLVHRNELERWAKQDSPKSLTRPDREVQSQQQLKLA
jgi:excisionase family DNA binding protein